MNIGLEINDTEISLGMTFDRQALTEAKIKKMGFIDKALCPIVCEQGDIMLWAKNPLIQCIDYKISARANLDRSLGSEFMYGTSAFLFFTDNELRYVICQIIKSHIVAREFNRSFREAACERFGKPAKLKLSRVPYTDMGITIHDTVHLEYVWKQNGEMLISELGQSGSNAYLHWKQT